jgi:hypothetical protein
MHITSVFICTCSWKAIDVTSKMLGIERKDYYSHDIGGGHAVGKLFLVRATMRRCRWLSKLSATEKSRSPSECLAHGVQHHDRQGDRRRPYATPT